MRRIVVIGGGAAGMMAAIWAATDGAQVTIVEHKERIGKKLLSTGNGRCNFTNSYQAPSCYRSDNADFAWETVQRFDYRKVCAFFEQIGVYPKERNGYYYPYSDQASSVLDALRMELNRLRIRVLTGQDCRKIIPKKQGFRVELSQETLSCDAVILAAGSKAAPVTGSDGSGYGLAKELGHRILPVLPALVQLKCEESFFKSIGGVRVQGKVSVYGDGRLLSSDVGEIQLTAYGISGIPVFQVSRYASKALYDKKEVTAEIDFMPDMTEEAFLSFLHDRKRMRPQKPAEEFLTGLFPKKLNDLWIRLCKVSRAKTAGELTAEEVERLCSCIKRFSVSVAAANSFEQAQVCRGGVDTREVNPRTLESNYIPGLYFAGEILDVDGLCGGYNLQWAWSSGYVAGREAAGECCESIS